ncbi:Type I secretion system, outer membrane component LapE AggA [Caballeronia sordidicola]|uniref:Type I secretion system, outer membrane component LapE AggA n=2 Tax=Caballeronia sordidicola TaxID=196367 RepID=A0A226XB69_CABSO|nr:Type I secretion system, outer membrane component LapE AggA [Caballeronia sordidicola]
MFSSMGVLVATGVVALSFAAPDAEAKSALDEMAWMPQQAPLTQGSASDNGMAGAVALARAMTPGAVAKPLAVSTPVAAVAAPVVVERRAAPQPQLEMADTAPQAPVAASSAPQRSRGFSDMGLVDPVQPVTVASAAPVQSAVEPARARDVEAPRLVAPAWPIRSTSASVPASVPALAGGRAPNLQADLQSLRGSLATGAVATVADDDYTTSPTDSATASAGRTGSKQQALDSQPGTVSAGSLARTRRTAGGASPADRFSDWLDDGSGARMRNNQAVVPEQAVRAALRNAADAAAERSPTIRQARNDWEAAKFDVDQVKGQRYPQVQVGANSPSITGDSASFNQYNRPTASVAITTMIYDWGKTSKSIDSRKKTADAAEFYYQTVTQQNAYDVSQSLVELAKNREIYAIGESYVKRMSQLVDMLVEIVRIDPGRMSELTQAKSRLLQAQTSQEVVAAQLRSLQLSVNKLVGSEPTPMPGGTRWQLQLDGLDDAVAAVSTNPQIEQLNAEAEAAKLSAKSVRADGLPKLNWVINKNTAPDVFGNRQPWSTMLQLSWTPFQGGSQRAAERAALSRADSSSDKRDQLVLDSEYKVRDAHRDAIALSTRAKMYEDQAVETDLIRKQFFEQWYHLNRRTLLDVLSAESDFYNNQVSETTARFDAYQDVLKVHLNNGTMNSWLSGA